MPRGSARPGQLGPYWLSKRPNSDQWCRTWFEARQTRRESLGTPDFQEAGERLADWYVANRAPRDERPASVGIEELMARHYALHGQHLRSAKAVQTSMGFWADYFAGAMLSDVTPGRVGDFVTVLLDSGKSSGYVRRILSDGKAAIGGAMKRGEITSAPFINLALAPEGEPRERILSLEEMAALYGALDAPHVKNYVLLALGTMARPEALTDLTTWSIDWQSGSINLLPTGKRQNKKHRPTVPIRAYLAPAARQRARRSSCGLSRARDRERSHDFPQGSGGRPPEWHGRLPLQLATHNHL